LDAQPQSQFQEGEEPRLLESATGVEELIPQNLLPMKGIKRRRLLGGMLYRTGR